jgi:hypothetical protein
MGIHRPLSVAVETQSSFGTPLRMNVGSVGNFLTAADNGFLQAVEANLPEKGGEIQVSVDQDADLPNQTFTKKNRKDASSSTCF